MPTMESLLIQLADEDKIAKTDWDNFKYMFMLFALKCMATHKDFSLHFTDLLDFDISDCKIELQFYAGAIQFKVEKKSKVPKISACVPILSKEAAEVVEIASKVTFVDLKDYSPYRLKEIDQRFVGQFPSMISRIEGFSWTDRLKKLIMAYETWVLENEKI
jgi:hypothetical protein